MQGQINCQIQIGLYKRPEDTAVDMSESLVKVYATMDIEKGQEILMEYGPDYFNDS